MNAYVVTLSKYANTGILALFTMLSYLGFFVGGKKTGRAVEIIQRLLLMAFLLNANMTIAWIVRGMQGRKLALLCGMEILFLIAFMVLYRIVHEMANMILFNNLCMLLSIGFVIIARISFYGSSDEIGQRSNEPVKQFVMASAGLMIMLIIPFFRRFFDSLRHFGIVYGVAGIIVLGGVKLLNVQTNGANITYTIAGFTFQPSEFVKILYILMLAAILSGEVTVFKGILVSVLAVLHVGILVLSRDLGSALIFFVVYLMMLFLASGKWSVFFGGAGLGAAGAIVCYFLFAHVQERVQIWRDPFSQIDTLGFQIAHSLFAISYGGLWGAGLTQGAPAKIPLVESDFIFSAIVEEMGLVFGICLLLLCINCFVRVLILSAGYSNRFFQLFTYGAAVCYIFQTFLTVGGETKFIPLTGVTLPLVSYGGSSVLSTLTMFGIIEMIFILHDERTARFIARYEEEQQAMKGENEAGSFQENSFRQDSGGYAGQGLSGGYSGQVPSGGYAGQGLSGGYSGQVPSGGYAGQGFVRGNAEPSHEGLYGDWHEDLPDNFPVNGISEDGIFDNQ